MTRRPLAQLVNIAWMSDLYAPGEAGKPFVPDGFTDAEQQGYGTQVASDAFPEHEGPYGSDLGRADVRDDPAWSDWLEQHMSRDDVTVMLRVDDTPKRKLTGRWAKKAQEWGFTYWVPVQDFLAEGATERSVTRAAVCDLYRAVAERLSLPEPPPNL